MYRFHRATGIDAGQPGGRQIESQFVVTLKLPFNLLQPFKFWIERIPKQVRPAAVFIGLVAKRTALIVLCLSYLRPVVQQILNFGAHPSASLVALVL